MAILITLMAGTELEGKTTHQDRRGTAQPLPHYMECLPILSLDCEFLEEMTHIYVYIHIHVYNMSQVYYILHTCILTSNV